MAPLCGVAAVATVEKSGAARAAPRPSTDTAAMASLGDRPQQREGQDGHDAEDAGHQHEGAQGGNQFEVRPKQHVTPPDRGGQAGGQADAADPGGTALPQAHGGDADQPTQRRRQGDRVVRVDDALAQRDGEADARPASRPTATARPVHGRCGGGGW